MISDPPWMMWKELAAALGKEIRRILKPNHFACVYPGNPTEDYWNDALRQFLTKEWRLAAINSQPHSFYRGSILNAHIPILLYRSQPTGMMKTFRSMPDVFRRGPDEKQYHPWQQPVSDAMTLILSLSKPGDLICDLTAGSGTVAVATAMVGEGRRFIGCEIDPKTAALAQTRVAEFLAKKPA